MQRPPRPTHRNISGVLILLGCLFLLCWWQIRVLGDLREQLGVFYVLYALAFLGYLGVLWVIRRHAANAKGRSLSILPLIIILLVGLCARLMLLDTQPVFSPDVYRYQWDGRVQLAGIDPYAYAPDTAELSSLRDKDFQKIIFPHLRTVYPPAAELAFRLGASIGSTVTSQKAVFLFVELVLVASLLFILMRRGISLLWVAAYLWHPLPILEIAGSGHSDVLAAAALCVGLAAWEARRWLGCSLAWVIAFLSKFVSIVLVPWFWFRMSARRWLALFILLSVLPLIAHPALISALVGSLSAMTGRVESNSSVYLLASWIVKSHALALWLLIGLWAVFLIWWARREDDPARYLLGALSVQAFLSPVLHPWYLICIIPLFCVWRPPVLITLSATVIVAYTLWPGYLREGRWVLPTWARAIEYGPVLLIGLWELRRILPGRWATKQAILG